ncbi:DUF4810 domain-containing protein [Leptothrix discophora]|uniref:DUF4810 domain-containing protein n=1 Tax=Leptothrix discophora TaxID=89 RepID=A0ABT9FZW1_LEPDI|nr:DUF4810 domain-containing protein [Leptothrix discophora]MDP4299770.1 DUF4810 domain-containing protein [Leptothrix discophora]
MHTPRHVPAIALLVLLTGCAQAPKPLYDWGSYPSQVYVYLKGDGSGPSTQAGELEADARKIESNGGKLPPGFRAHLGMLYQTLGQDDLARQQLQAEKEWFPEGAHFVEFLLAKGRTGGAK